MIFDYTSVKNEMDENDLKKLRIYVDSNKESIERELSKLNQIVVPVPLNVIIGHSNAHLEEKYHTIIFTKGNDGKIDITFMK